MGLIFLPSRFYFLLQPFFYHSSIQSNLGRGTVVIDSKKGETKEVTDLYMKESKYEIKEKTRKVEVGAQRKKMFVTDLGFKVNSFLQEHFAPIINVSFTSNFKPSAIA